MIQHIPAKKRAHIHQEWLDTYHLFSFASHYDPMNVEFGNLRVFNDDTIGAYSGFDEHPHDNMEIVTVMLEGTLTHRDSMGNQAAIKAGEVQCMTAGTGVIHAEKNLGNVPVHLYQIWLYPKTQNLTPSYSQLDITHLEYEKNVLHRIASPEKQENALTLNAETSIYLSTLEQGQKLNHALSPNQGLFLYLTSGSLEVNGITLEKGDQARITDEDSIILTAKTEAHFIAIQVQL